jgi:hypothetical protein
VGDWVEKQYNRHFISSEDFIEARDYLKEYSEDLSQVIRRALLSAAIVAYCRPFTNNKGKGEAIPTLPKSIVVELDGEERQLHEKLLKLRHEVVAHSDYEAKACSRVGDGVVAAKPFDVLWEEIDTSLFARLADHMAYVCAKKGMDLDKQYPL